MAAEPKDQGPITQLGGDATRTPVHPHAETPVATDAKTLVPAAGSGSGAVVLPPAGYAIGNQLGKGGMGEVLAATDLRIGREVAVKRMINTRPDGEEITRFLREARIQARLEHPAIVPVHELGVDDSGRPFFTMKRLAGKTLAHKHAERAPQKRLLRAFAEVCLCVDFAHSRGVVHRDLKPSNIMLGDYGEVYVIDWGIARVLADDVHDMPTQQGDITTLDDHKSSTSSGSMLGTPGYMSPEQVRGLDAEAGADVYSLGCILFELLTDEPLHKRGNPGLATTLSHPQVAPSARKPDAAIPPELDEACFAALAEVPEQRPTARALADQINAFLDGDRDLERRREIACEQVIAARSVLESGSDDARASAMRRAGRAIALDPENEQAAEIVGALLLEPPPADKMPADLVARLDEDDRRTAKERSRRGVWAYLSIFCVLPLALVLDIRNWPLLIAFYGLVTLGALSAAYYARTGEPRGVVAMAINFGLALVFTRLAGPFVLTPVMICCALVGITPIPAVMKRKAPILVWTLIVVMTPIVLEWAGFLPKTWEIANGRMKIISDMVHTHGRVDELALIAANLLFIFVVALMLLTINRARRDGQRRLFIQAWHLRQLLPHAKRAWATMASDGR